MLLRVACLASVLVASGIACANANDDDVDANEGAVIAGPLSVLAASGRSCSTESVRELSTQLVAEINCAHPRAIASLEGTPGLLFEREAFPFAQAPLVDALTKASSSSRPIHVTSMLRTLPQQYLLSRWAAAGRCQIPMAARPGTSNHEGGLAVDVDNYAAMRSILTKPAACPSPKSPKRACFAWLGEKDPFHFDFQGDGAVDLAGESVRAFQRLWNKNHPNDAIKETGTFDAATEARLKVTPATGFSKGPECPSNSQVPVELPEPPPPEDSSVTE